MTTSEGQTFQRRAFYFILVKKVKAPAALLHFFSSSVARTLSRRANLTISLLWKVLDAPVARYGGSEVVTRSRKPVATGAQPPDV